jgi:hypothetical protein
MDKLDVISGLTHFLAEPSRGGQGIRALDEVEHD